jgi:GT2 family glycosyltransferase
VKVGIVVLNYNGREDTLECVRSLARIAYPAWRLTLVDNGSTVRIKDDVLAILPGARVIERDVNEGFTGGNNIGARAALADGADGVLLLNNDTVVDPGFLDPLVEAMRLDPRVGMATPKIYCYDSRAVLWGYGARIDRTTGRSPHIGTDETDRGQFDRIEEVDRITGCAMFVRRELFERVGFLDDRFFIYEEEIDWCLRARRAGYRLRVVPQSIIWHKGHRDSGRIGRPFMTYLQTRNHLLLIRKHADAFVGGGLPAVAYAGLAAARGIVRGRGSWRHTRAIVEGWRDAILGHYGRPAPHHR